jgi:hypothetical protein
MQVACQVCSGITLNRPFVDGVNFNTLPMGTSVAQRLLLQMLILLQHLEGLLILLLGAA